MDYTNEDNEKALEVLRDLVHENSELKRELLHIRRFLLAQLLNSENGEIRFLDTFRHDEDLDELLGGIQFEIQTNSTQQINGVTQGSYMYAVQQHTVSVRHKLSKEELLEEFEKRRFKDEREELM